MSAIVETRRGRVEGATDGAVLAFLGIPYAQPPTGERRWRAPRPITGWDGVLDATRPSPTAPQVPQPSAILPRDPQPMDEDCLALNVWTPAADNARRPVMVWIHGGAFTGGAGSTPWYRGASLAARGDVVVVTINYRLGVLGFLADPALAAAAGEPWANFGLLDQVAALDWVQAEIEAFGGDAANVTVFGESAGGMSVGALMGSPLAAGRFQRAIAQSGAAHTALSADEAAMTMADVLEPLGLDAVDGDAMRALPLERLLEAQSHALIATARRMRGLLMPFQPVIDGRVLPALPIEGVRSGLVRSVPTLAGTTADEWRLFTAMTPPGEMDDGRAARRIGRLFPAEDEARAGALFAAYREARVAAGEPAGPVEIFEAAQTDFGFRVPADRLLEAQAALGTPTFAYRFDRPAVALDGALGACHAVEIPYVFGTLDASPEFSGTDPEAWRLSERVQDAWIAFARTGDPSTADLPWPRFDADRRQTMLLDDECRVVDAPREPERRCWDGIVV